MNKNTVQKKKKKKVVVFLPLRGNGCLSVCGRKFCGSLTFPVSTFVPLQGCSQIVAFGPHTTPLSCKLMNGGELTFEKCPWDYCFLINIK